MQVAAGSPGMLRAARGATPHWVRFRSIAPGGPDLLSFSTPILRGGRIDGYLLISLDVERAAHDLTVQLAPPTSVEHLVTADLISQIDFLDLTAAPSDKTRSQRIFASIFSAIPYGVAPAALDRHHCEVNGNLLTPKSVQCDYSAPNNSLHLRSVASLGPDPAALDWIPLSLALFAISVFTAVIAWFSVSIFGHKWATIKSESDVLPSRLRGALATATHDLRPIVQSLRTEVRILRSPQTEGAPNPVREVLRGAVGRLRRTVGNFDVLTQNFRGDILTKAGSIRRLRWTYIFHSSYATPWFIIARKES